MAVTLRDIAKALNLSHATVSFVLNDRRDVAIPEATRQRVLDMACQMGYVPNHIARALVSGRTQMVAVWASTPIEIGRTLALRAVVRALSLRGHGAVLCESGEQASMPNRWPVDGVIQVDCPEPYPVSGRKLPLVSIGFADASIDQVSVDMSSAYESSVSFLRQKGCRSVAFVAAETDQDRARQFCDAAGQSGLTAHVAPSASEAVLRGADGYLCDSEQDALLCLCGLAAEGVRREVVVTSSRKERPGPLASLSAILLPVDEVARLAVDALMRRIVDPHLSPSVAGVPATFEPTA